MTHLPRRFHLQRDRDPAGVSGTGRVANGVLWPDGAVTLRWLGRRPSTVNWASLADAEEIHCHAGATRIVWDDPDPADDGQPEPESEAVAGVQNWMALDLHQALRRPVDPRSEAVHQGHATWTDWWTSLLADVAALADTDFLRATDPDTPTP